MFNFRRTARPVTLLPVIFSILVLVSFAPTALSQDDYPPESDTIEHLSQFVSCNHNNYALCFYSGPTAPQVPNAPALPCVLNEDNTYTCTCYLFYHDDPVNNYVLIGSILEKGAREETRLVCGDDGENCINIANEKKECAGGEGLAPCIRAPICGKLGGPNGSIQTLYHGSDYKYISTYSSRFEVEYGIVATNTPTGTKYCEKKAPYAGCMTAGCKERYKGADGTYVVDCTCPTYTGTFQIPIDRSCYLGGDNVWSASNNCVIPDDPRVDCPYSATPD